MIYERETWQQGVRFPRKISVPQGSRGGVALRRLSTFAGEPNNHRQQTPPTIKSSLHDLQVKIKALEFSKLTSIYSTEDLDGHGGWGCDFHPTIHNLNNKIRRQKSTCQMPTILAQKHKNSIIEGHTSKIPSQSTHKKLKWRGCKGGRLKCKRWVCWANPRGGVMNMLCWDISKCTRRCTLNVKCTRYGL